MTAFWGVRGPVLGVLMPGHDGAIARELAEELRAPEEKVGAEDVLDVVQQGGRPAQIVDPTVGLVPTVDAADVDAVRQPLAQGEEAAFDLADAFRTEEGQVLDEALLLELLLFGLGEPAGVRMGG